MWILMNDSMLSIVRHTGRHGSMLVRSRLTGDIERVFPSAQVEVDGGSDYRFRATLPEGEVADAISRRLLTINYGNFKASVREPSRHQAYRDVWNVMHKMQEQARKLRGSD